MKLLEILRFMSDWLRLARNVTALTGGTSGVEGVNITNGGTGYSNSFSVTFSGGGGSGAAATATAVNGVITSVTVTNAGSGYTSAPTPSFTAGGGTGAAGTTLLTAHTLDAIKTVGVSVGVIVIFRVGSDVHKYRLRAGTDAESSPLIIRPDDYATTTNEKVWELQGASLLRLIFGAATNAFPMIKRVTTGMVDALADDSGPTWRLGTRLVTPKTSGYSVLAFDSKTCFSNEGAGGEVNFTLPTAAANLMFTFVIQAAQNLRVTAASGDTIRIAGSASAAAGNILASTIGNSVTLIAINATEWVAVSSIGTWTVT